MAIDCCVNDVFGGQWWRLIVVSTTFLVGNGSAGCPFGSGSCT